MEDERRNWLSERTGKSVESKKIIVTMKIEIEEANKRNRELETKCKELTKFVFYFIFRLNLFMKKLSFLCPCALPS